MSMRTFANSPEGRTPKTSAKRQLKLDDCDEEETKTSVDSTLDFGATLTRPDRGLACNEDLTSDLCAGIPESRSWNFLEEPEDTLSQTSSDHSLPTLPQQFPTTSSKPEPSTTATKTATTSIATKTTAAKTTAAKTTAAKTTAAKTTAAKPKPQRGSRGSKQQQAQQQQQQQHASQQQGQQGQQASRVQARTSASPLAAPPQERIQLQTTFGTIKVKFLNFFPVVLLFLVWRRQIFGFTETNKPKNQRRTSSADRLIKKQLPPRNVDLHGASLRPAFLHQPRAFRNSGRKQGSHRAGERCFPK
jgi:hypothetical protein